MLKITTPVSALSLLLVLGLSACEEDSPKTPASAPLTPCLDRPGTLERAPDHGLPCDLLPPDFRR